MDTRFSMPAKLCAVGMLMASTMLFAATPAAAARSVFLSGFEGTDLRDNITVGGGFIPPDTMGAIGSTQYVSILNGSFSVFDRFSGTRTLFQSDQTFYQNAGATLFGTSYSGGDPRVMFNAEAQRWVATGFGGDRSYLNIAVSDTADATGAWKATTFLGFNGAAGAGVADYATLALDTKAVYIGTNDFDTPGGFVGTTLHVIPLSDVFQTNLSAPTVTNRAQFVTPTSGTDRGFAIQGVNSTNASAPGKVVADSRDLNDNVAYNINNPELGNAGATQGAVNVLGVPYICCYNARQPDGTRNIETVGARTGSSAYEHNGKIYYTTSVASAPVGGDQIVRVTVLDSVTFSVVQQIDIGTAGYDSYMPSIAVTEFGAVVGYNRSGGANVANGNISFLANAYTLDANGLLVFDATHLLKYSDNPSYQLIGSGRNRWGDYSSVTIDPNNARNFWAIGEYANFRNAQGGDGWGTYIAQIGFVPEPSTWLMMILGFGVVGGALRSQRKQNLTVSFG